MWWNYPAFLRVKLAPFPIIAGLGRACSTTRRCRAEDFEFEQVPFDHPLWILFSSGTTGLPKPIVHGHGGIVIEMFKTLSFHIDLHPGERAFFFTTTGWMMWNVITSMLMVGACPVLYDGNAG